MPLSFQQILDHADELARVFEEYEPRTPAGGGGTPLGDLQRAVTARADAERAILAAVAAARADGFSWSIIGAYLGTSGEAARQRYRKLIAA
jgi:hypothetical protein